MARATDDDVTALVEVDEDLAPSLSPFIVPAALLVDRHCTGGDLTEDELLQIEAHLAAHFYATHRDMRLTAENIGGEIQSSYQSKVDLGFDSTHYGQTAMRLDATGSLALLNAQSKAKIEGGSVNTRQRVGITWLGINRDAEGRDLG